MQGMDANRRKELLDRVRRVLESLGEDEPPPEGVDPALERDDPHAAADMATLAAEAAHSAREIAIQSRILKRLAEGVEPLPGAVSDLAARVESIRVPEPAEWARAVTDASATVHAPSFTTPHFSGESSAPICAASCDRRCARSFASTSPSSSTSPHSQASPIPFGPAGPTPPLSAWP